MSSVEIPDIVIGRLPLYLRTLSRLTLEGVKITSSHELGRRLGISSAQIRKDLSHFGEFGKQGTGYQIEYLTDQLRRILKVDKEWKVALVGVGDLGRALAHYNGFRDRGFRITMLFDNDPAKVGTMLDGFQIYDSSQMKDLIRQHGITLAMIAVPAEAAQKVSDALVSAGVRGLLNYAPINLAVPEGVKVQYIDPVVHLQRITYYVEE
jgi:redox-sensing transcriptional repressor